MAKYDQRVAERLEKEKTVEEVDEEGWVIVTGRKKRGESAFARKESTLNKLQNKLESSVRKKQLRNFYTFQIREAKRQSKYFVFVISIFHLRIYLINFYIYRLGGTSKEIRIG